MVVCNLQNIYFPKKLLAVACVNKNRIYLPYLIDQLPGLCLKKYSSVHSTNTVYVNIQNFRKCFFSFYQRSSVWLHVAFPVLVDKQQQEKSLLAHVDTFLYLTAYLTPQPHKPLSMATP